jgi:O-antigen/teichoic acid export membrane protein
MPRLISKGITISAVILAMRASVMACKFGLAIFVGRYLDLASLGLYGLSVGAIAIAPVVVGMGMVHVIMRDAVILPLCQLTNHLRHYWAFTFSVYVLALIVAVILTVLFKTSGIWILIIVIMMFEHFGNDVFQLLSNLERPLAANVNAFLRGAAWILIYIPFALWDDHFRSLTALFGFWLGGSALATGVFFITSRSWPWKAALAQPLELSWITKTIKNSFLLYISDLSFVGSQYSDRYLVTLFLGLELAGVYFLYWSVASAASTLVSMTVLQLQRPLLIKAHHEGNGKHRQLSSSFIKNTAWVTVVLAVATGCAFYLLLPLLKQPAVADHLSAFWLIMAALGVRNVADAGAMSLFTAHRDRIVSITNVTSMIALVAAQVTLLPLLGLYGAGAAILLTFLGIALWRFRLIFGSSSGSTKQ